MLFEQLNPHACRTYLIANEKERTAVLVDPVIDHFQDYLKILKGKNFKLTHVIDTHTHADHISSCSSLKDATECEYLMHENAPSRCVTVRVSDGEIIGLNGIDIKIIHTPGHTRDSISLVIEDKFLTGDFLFLDDAGGGRDDLPGGNPSEHWDSLHKISALPDNLIVYPAHEYRNRQPSSLGIQRKTNPHLKNRSKENFVRYLEDLRLGPAEWMKDVLKANYACAKDPKAAWIPIDSPACEIKGTLEKSVNETEVKYITAMELRTKLSYSLNKTEDLAIVDSAYKRPGNSVIMSDMPFGKLTDELSGNTLDTSADTLSGKLLLLDVREEAELKDSLGAIDGVVNIPVGSLVSRLKELDDYKDKEIIVICRSGARATTGAQILIKSGFGNVLVLEGGMTSWRKNLL